MATLYIRVPDVVKHAIERNAKAKGMSVNMYVQRLLEADGTRTYREAKKLKEAMASAH